MPTSGSEAGSLHEGHDGPRERRHSLFSTFVSGTEGRRGSILADILPDTLPLPPSFVSTAPIVQEILVRDIAECSSEEVSDSECAVEDGDEVGEAHENGTHTNGHANSHANGNSHAAPIAADAEPEAANGHHHHAPFTDAGPAPTGDVTLAFHPNGVAFGYGYSTVPIQGLDRPVPNPREREESINAELSLLRDNDIIPPSSRHQSVVSQLRRRSSVGSVGPTGGDAVERLYRRIFSTKVRDHEEPVPVLTSGAAADEWSPLLSGGREVETVCYDGLAEGIPTPPADEVHERWEEAVAANIIKTTWQREAKTLIQYSAPLIVTFLLHYSVTIASVLTVGRLGMVELAAVNLATMTASITCYVPVQGLATCLDTLCAQAYGSGHLGLVGLQAQRMTWFLWILMVPIAFLWWFSEPILEALVPGEDTAKLAALYLRVLILGMPGVAAFESGKRFVQAQGLFRATTYTLLIGAPLSFLQNWLFVFKFGWYFAGAALAMAVTQNLLPIILVFYVSFIEGSQCWRGFSRKAFNNWGPMIRLALPGMIMIEAQFSVLEILTIAAGQLGTAQLAAQSVLVTVTSTSFNIPFPLAIATSTRVANLIGAHLGTAAMKTARVAIAAACLVGLFNMTVFIALRRKLPRVFTDDDEVVDIASQVIVVCAVMQIFDALAAVSHGILRGVGRQAVGGYANLFSYYCVALPVSLATAFALGWGLSGLWAGLMAGLAVVSALELLYLYHSDWESAVAQAAARMQLEDINVAEPKRNGPV